MFLFVDWYKEYQRVELVWCAFFLASNPSFSLFIRSLEEAGPVTPLASSLAAGFSAAAAAVVSHPFDTAKVRSQAAVLPKVVFHFSGTCYLDLSSTLNGNSINLIRVVLA